MIRLFFAVVAAATFATGAFAQSDEAGPLATPAGQVQFTRADKEFVATLDANTLDRFSARVLTHFDDYVGESDTVSRMLVDTDAGPVLYDFRARPPVVLHIDKRMTIRRVFWQGDEVVMQGSQGWFRFEHGVLTKLQSSTTIYH
jgi:hypothetical protein